jgi:glyoxylase-like metal-dependent hydrolase (beta-lactamase superfamily II)
VPPRELVPGVLVARSRFWMTNAGVVWGERGAALLVDPGVLPDELDALARLLAARGRSAAAAVATHAHWDHVLWAGDLGDAPRLATPGTVELLARHRAELVEEPLVAEGRRLGVAWDVDLAGRLAPLADGQPVPWPGPEATLIPVAGHLPGQAALWLPGPGVLFAADAVSDIDPPLPFWPPPDAAPRGLDPCREGLDALARAAPVRAFVPGHGTPGDGAELRRRIQADRRYLDALERAVAPVARAGGGEAEALRAAGAVRDARLERHAEAREGHAENVRGLLRALSGAGGG